MNRWVLRAGGALVVLAVVAWIVLTSGTSSPEEGPDRALDARRLLGRAYYENHDYTRAAEQYRRCVALDPESAADYFNLGLVLLRAGKQGEALEALAKARAIDPDLLAVDYLRGILFKRQSKFDQAVQSLKLVIDGDPRCGGAHYNLGVCLKALRRYEEAIAAFRKKVEIAPDDPSAHYQLMTLYRQLGDVDGAERHGEIFARVKDNVDKAERTPEALERSKYSDLIDAPRLTEDIVPRPTARVRFRDITEASGLAGSRRGEAPRGEDRASGPETDRSPEALRARHARAVGGAVALGDYDGDGDVDIYVVNCARPAAASANRLFRNQGDGSFVDVTQEAGVGDPGQGMDAVFGDVDNDGHLDLYIVNCGPNVLYRNRGDGTFEDVSAKARADEPSFGRRAVFVDYDHDNDLDLLIGNDVDFASPKRPPEEITGAPHEFEGLANSLLRNRGAGAFEDRTDAAGLLVAFAQTRDVLFGDLDGDGDTDLFVVNADSESRLFLNARMGKFEVGGSFSPPVPAGASAAAEGDFNHDGRSDLVIAAGGELYLYSGGGGAAFTGRKIPLPAAAAGSGVERIRVFDYNRDGWSDLLLVLAGRRSPGLLAASGAGTFTDVTARVGLDRIRGEVVDIDVGDVDRDGDEEIVLETRDRGPVLLDNVSEESSAWLALRLVGKKVNKRGVGAVVEIASGGHYQRRVCRTGRVRFGLGGLDRVDVVRVTWPNGVAQNVVGPALDVELKVEEIVRVSASCGFLWAYNGRRFELINEILGIGPLGVPMAPGVYHQPDCTELTKIASRQLAARNGFYELRLTEELRETMYVDRVALRVVDHPAGVEVIPNEMFTAPPFPEDKLFAVPDPRPPVGAVDDRGADVLALVRERDGRVPTFPMTPYEGLGRPHALTLDLGDLAGAERILLLLDAWIYWPESSTVMAISQDPRFAIAPLKLEVRDERGVWQVAIASVGLPTSKGLVVPVDLTGRFPGRDFHVRLSTNLCVYFDRVAVATRDEAGACRVTELEAVAADLRFRGFSRMRRDALGYERFDYDEVNPLGPWNPANGLYTRYGDVTDLLARTDDRYAVIGAGDEIALRFPAGDLPALPEGWTRDFVFFAGGWVKDGDLNTLSSQSVSPLPFHGMSGYPYPAGERYPDSPEIRDYLRTYQTRRAPNTVGPLRVERP